MRALLFNLSAWNTDTSVSSNVEEARKAMIPIVHFIKHFRGCTASDIYTYVQVGYEGIADIPMYIATVLLWKEGRIRGLPFYASFGNWRRSHDNYPFRMPLFPRVRRFVFAQVSRLVDRYAPKFVLYCSRQRDPSTLLWSILAVIELFTAEPMCETRAKRRKETV
jgi:hypothetical protein